MAVSPTVSSTATQVDNATPSLKKVATIQTNTRLLQGSTPLVNADYVPSNWSIEADGADKIRCTNNITGATFSGTISEFNAALKG